MTSVSSADGVQTAPRRCMVSVRPLSRLCHSCQGWQGIPYESSHAVRYLNTNAVDNVPCHIMWSVEYDKDLQNHISGCLV
ncbi:hypothetical protein AMATHDRAFT_70894 [Amanita thiersii Skay4041]|uniref:Uncharacterized protein n=1 Tax=Amanita thiersii Skay4041 TaxID=703135 RepID=A0A2A9N7C5_9AGAR|nr:hypothetical protein AMATHDRAFT_70894 [Amanita thiersii Skay4041]